MSTAAHPRAARPAADPAGWPDVMRVPRSPLRAVAARQLIHHAAARLPLRIALPGGQQIGGGGPADPVLILDRPRDFYQRLGAAGLIGFGESYMAGDWDCADLTGLLTVFARHVDSLVPPPLQRLRNAVVRRPPLANDASATGARRNISHHYDLPPALFTLFLDETMTYSAALFGQDAAGRPHASASNLAAAQRRKIDRLLDLTGTGPGSQVLEIGTGWGERMLATRRTHTWILKYIFPGGLIPSVTAIEENVARTRLHIAGQLDFGAHYAETLNIWRKQFSADPGAVARLGFDDVFRRMWTLYLCYAEAGFRSGYLDVSQLLLNRPGDPPRSG